MQMQKYRWWVGASCLMLAVAGQQAWAGSAEAPFKVAGKFRRVPVEPFLCRSDAPPKCPAVLAAAEKLAAADCTRQGGELSNRKATADAEHLYAYDLNGDGRPEYAFNTRDMYECSAAPIADCPDATCAYTLYQQQGGQWQVIGHMKDPEHSKILSSSTDGYADLLQDEHRSPLISQWQAGSYARTRARQGNWWLQTADMNDPLLGQWSDLAEGSPVLATPADNAKVLYTQPAGASFVRIIGRVVNKPDFYYVNTCQACGDGFVKKVDIKKQ